MLVKKSQIWTYIALDNAVKWTLDTVKLVYKDRPREMLKAVFRRGWSLYEGFV